MPGQSFGVSLLLWNGGEHAVRVSDLAPALPGGWSARPVDELPGSLAPGQLLTRRFVVQVPPDAPLTRPYFLRQPRQGDLYRWPAELHGVGVPFLPSPVRAAARVAVDGAAVPATAEVTFRSVDKREGEARRPVRVVPRVSVLLQPELAVVPLDDRTPDSLRFSVRLLAAGDRPTAGVLRLGAPAGWRVTPDSLPLRLDPGAERVESFTLRPPARLAPGDARVTAVLTAGDGARFDQGYTLVDYPHIRPRALYRPAEARVRAFEVHVPRGLSVGYVAGAGDDAPEALRELGIPVTLLGPEALATGDLGRFDAILTGIRAYEVRPDLVAHNDRLLDYVRRGGTLVVQYNKYEFTAPGLAPYPVTMARPHDRVTDEDAAVRLLDPAAKALSWPNRIGPADFEGWVQERGLYFLHSWDPRFVPLLEMADPGEAPLRGALLVGPATGAAATSTPASPSSGSSPRGCPAPTGSW